MKTTIFQKLRSAGIQLISEKCLLALFFTAGALLICNQAGAQIGISPSRLYFEGSPGETVSRTLTLNNSGTKSIEFSMSLKDWKRDSVGSKIYAAAGTMPQSNAKQIKFAQTTITLEPGEHKTVPVFMEIPKSISDSTATNSMLYFTQTTPEPQKTDHPSIGIQVAYEYAIQLFYNPFGVKTGDLEILDFKYLPGVKDGKKENQQQLQLRYKNTGNINKTATLRLEMTNQKTGEEVSFSPRDLAIMPNGYQIVNIDLPQNLNPGDYLLIALLEADTAHQRSSIKVAKKSIQIK